MDIFWLPTLCYCGIPVCVCLKECASVFICIACAFSSALLLLFASFVLFQCVCFISSCFMTCYCSSLNAWPVCFLRRDSKDVYLNGRGYCKNLEGVEEGESIFIIYYIKIYFPEEEK